MHTWLSIRTSRALGCLLCLFSVSACVAQAAKIKATHYQGRVIDNSTGKPIEAARITVLPATCDGAWRTDSRGRFSFWTTRQESSHIEIEHDGYQTFRLSPRPGDLSNLRMEPDRTATTQRASLATSDVGIEVLPASQSVAPAIMTADSAPKWSGPGKTWSHWYRLGVGKAPGGYTVEKVEFWLTGDGACGLSAQCHEVSRSDQQVLWEFRLQGHNEIGAPLRTETVAHIRAVYRPIE